MKWAIIRNAMFFAVSFVLCGYVIGLSFPPDDLFYAKMARKRSHRLVFGTSLAACGINPSVLGKGGQNFAFNMATSPYGETYYHAINRKLAPRGDGLFIVEVSPLAVSDMVYYGPEPREARRHLGIIRRMSGHPNYEFLLRGLRGVWAGSVSLDGVPPTFEYRPYLPESDRHKVRDRVLRYYRQHCSSATPSKERMYWLRMTLRLLRNHGEVFLVRLPTGKEILRMEASYWPDFWTVMKQLAEQERARAIDFTSKIDGVRTVDGHHLGRRGTDAVSEGLRRTFARHYTR